MADKSIILHIKAPLGVSRMISTGNYRGTYPVLSPTTLYGLACNLAGIEMRKFDSGVGNNIIKDDLPELGIQVGYVTLPFISRLFEHSTKEVQTSKSVNSIKEQLLADHIKNHGDCVEPDDEIVHRISRQFIKPKRSDYLSVLDFYVSITATYEITERIRRYLSGVNVDPIMGTNNVRYGMPFIGSNNCMIELIKEVDSIPEIDLFWLMNMNKDTIQDHEFGVYMPVWIDRKQINTRFDNYSIVKGRRGDMIMVGPKSGGR